MRKMIAFCGLDCEKCPAYIATQANDGNGLRETAERWSRKLNLTITPEDCICDGCQPTEGGRLGGYCNECPMRACGIRKGHETCAHCDEYPCDTLLGFFARAPEVKDQLDALRKGLKG